MRTIPLYETSFLLIVWILLCFSFTSCNVESTPESYSLKRELRELDDYVNNRENYSIKKENSILVLQHYLRDSTISSVRRYSLCYSMAEAYYTYNYDSTVFYLDKCVQIAKHLNDNVSWDKANTKLGYVYVSSGNYLQAFDALYIKIDSATVAPTIRTDYYEAMYKMSKQVVAHENIRQLDGTISSPDYYRNILLNLFPKGTYKYNLLLVEKLIEQGDLKEAASLNRSLLDKVSPVSHEFAKRAYAQFELENYQNNKDYALFWLIQSAKADMYNAIRDYSALNELSNRLADYDLTRSYNYLQVALKDAISYNSRLRPLQISHFIQRIDMANTKHLVQKHKTSVAFLVLSIVVICFVIWQSYILMIHSKKLSKALRMLNSKNKELSEANSIKEHYIAQFFTILSDKIEGLKEYDSLLKKELRYGNIDNVIKILSSTQYVQQEIDAFYHIFDETFLSIYPTFVEDFNSLMRDDCKVVIKRGELLNTELRIFAMIRLGISKSETIAKLLRYSVRTIYNNKVKARNGANVPREKFDSCVLKIGGFTREKL